MYAQGMMTTQLNAHSFRKIAFRTWMNTETGVKITAHETGYVIEVPIHHVDLPGGFAYLVGHGGWFRPLSGPLMTSRQARDIALRYVAQMREVIAAARIDAQLELARRAAVAPAFPRERRTPRPGERVMTRKPHDPRYCVVAVPYGYAVLDTRPFGSAGEPVHVGGKVYKRRGNAQHAALRLNGGPEAS